MLLRGASAKLFVSPSKNLVKGFPSIVLALVGYVVLPPAFLDQLMFQASNSYIYILYIYILYIYKVCLSLQDTISLDQKPMSLDPILTLPTLCLGPDPTLKDAVVALPSQLEPSAEVVAAGSDLLKCEASKGTCIEMPDSSQEVCKSSATQDGPAKTNRSQEDMATDVLQHRPAVFRSLAPISPAELSKASRKTTEPETQEEEEEGHDADSEESEDSKPKTKKRKASAKSKAKARPKPKPKAKAKGKAAKDVAKPKRNTRKAKSSEGKAVEDEATSATKRPRRSPLKQGKRKASAPSAPSTPDPSPLANQLLMLRHLRLVSRTA
jgi:hypothetical protein